MNRHIIDEMLNVSAVVYKGGNVYFRGDIRDMDEDIARMCDRSDWYMLDSSVEECQVLFIVPDGE